MSTCLVRSLRLLAADSTRPGASSVLERFLTSHGVLSAGLCQSAAHTSVPERTATHSRAFSAAAAGAPNYYELLGVPQGASEGDIKKAYYKLAKQHHPDANPENDEAVTKFQEVQEAYDILKDPQKRAMYDQVGHQQFKNSGAGDADGPGQGFAGGHPFPGGFQGGFQGGGFAFHSGGGFGGAAAMEDMLGQFAQDYFGGGRKGRSSMYSSYQASTSVSITFMESLKGTKRKLTMHLGDGPETQEVEVDVPAGIENGSQLLMQDIIRTQQNRVSLVVQVQVQGLRGFIRKGDDIYSKLELKLSEALLGCKKEVETAWGPKAITVPEGTTASSRLTIDSMGAPRLKGSGRGRHILEIDLRLPQRLTSDQIRVVEELQKSGL